jgi:hypothetical protein
VGKFFAIFVHVINAHANLLSKMIFLIINITGCAVCLSVPVIRIKTVTLFPQTLLISSALRKQHNTKAYGGKTRKADSQNSDATAPSGRELYHLQFSLHAASPETFGYTLVWLLLYFSKVYLPYLPSTVHFKVPQNCYKEP